MINLIYESLLGYTPGDAMDEIAEQILDNIETWGMFPPICKDNKQYGPDELRCISLIDLKWNNEDETK